MSPRPLALLALLALVSLSAAVPYVAGIWQLDSDLGEPDAAALLAQISFSPQPAPPESAWRLSSQTLLFSAPGGDLVSSVSMAPSCSSAPSSPCAREVSVYRSEGAQVSRLGRLTFKSSNNLFGSHDSAPGPSAGNHSLDPPVSASFDLPASLPLEWLPYLTLGIVALILVLHLMQNRD